MTGETVVVLGAGATKACGGPLTNQILPWAFSNPNEIEREGYVEFAAQFVHNVFGIEPRGLAEPEKRIPSLTLILSLIDIALDRREALGPNWQQDSLARARSAFGYIIFAILEKHLVRIMHNPHVELFRRLNVVREDVPVISLNYDIIADNSPVKLAEIYDGDFADGASPDYGFDVASEFYQERPKLGRLLKLHGSLNCMYCANCNRVDLGLSESGRFTAKVIEELYNVRADLDPEHLTTRAAVCIHPKVSHIRPPSGSRIAYNRCWMSFAQHEVRAASHPGNLTWRFHESGGKLLRWTLARQA